MSIKNPKIHVIGSYAVGMTMNTKQFPRVGETIAGHNFKQIHGGKGANQAVAAARLGADVFFTTCLGSDVFGDLALKMLKREGINTSSVVQCSKTSTGVGFVMVGESGDNEILIDLGANEKLTAENIDEAFAYNFDTDIMLVQLEANLNAVYHALNLANKRNIPVILNPAPFRKVPDEFVSLATYITPNHTEASSLLGYSAEPQELCLKLYEKFKVKVILTAGEDGAYVLENYPNVIKVDGDKVDAIDTTGAGDCFSATLAVMIANGVDLLKAVKIANISAAMSVQISGVVESLPYVKDLNIKLQIEEEVL